VRHVDAVLTDSPERRRPDSKPGPLAWEVLERPNKTVSTSGFFFTGDRGFESSLSADITLYGPERWVTGRT
jgi:hypothetical protein